MPWKECSVMDERLQFVARRLADDGGRPLAFPSSSTLSPYTCPPQPPAIVQRQRAQPLTHGNRKLSRNLRVNFAE
jgi:hypothetical protein